MKLDLIIFTDGSAQIGKPQYGGYSCVIIDPKKDKFTVLYDNVNSDKTPYLELYAIYKAVLYAEEIRKTRKKKGLKILIVTDHKNHVDAFTDWIWNVWNLFDYDNWRKKNSGKPIKNQWIYREVLNVLSTGSIEMKIAHITSHTKRNKTGIQSVIDEMAEYNIEIDENIALMFMQFNQIADAYAKYGSNYYIKKFNKAPMRLR